MAQGHRFNIGDIVYHRLVPQGCDERKTPLLILAKVTVECLWGTQYEYECRLGCTSSLNTVTFDAGKLYRISDIELEAPPQQG